MTDLPEPGPLLSIGAFARVVRLSVKALRHYDAEGLLRPASVDPGSGYRSYSLTQVPQAATIALLRSLDVPLARIRRLLDASDEAERARLIDAERARVVAEVERRTRDIATLERLAAGPGSVRYRVGVEPRRAMTLHALRAVAATERLDVGTGAACERFAGVATAAGLALGPFVAVFPLDLDDPVEVAVGLPAAADEPPPGLVEVELPGGDWAGTIHVGPYDELPLAYAALLGGVADVGRDPAGPVVETYLVDPGNARADQLVTALAVALRP